MGYLTIAEYSADHGFSIALQTNTDATLGRSMHRHALRLSSLIVEDLKARADAAETAILDILRNQETCWNNQDINCYLEAFLPSAHTRSLSPSGILKGFDSIARAYRENWPPEKMGQLSYQDLHPELLRADLYNVTGRYNLRFQDGALRSGSFSALVQKIDGRWYLVAEHSN